MLLTRLCAGCWLETCFLSWWALWTSLLTTLVRMPLTQWSLSHPGSSRVGPFQQQPFRQPNQLSGK